MEYDPTKSVYEKFLEVGANMDHHESDLYVESSPEVLIILGAEYEHKKLFFTFFKADGKTWCEIPFAYDPFWERKGMGDSFVYKTSFVKNNKFVIKQEPKQEPKGEK